MGRERERGKVRDGKREEGRRERANASKSSSSKRQRKVDRTDNQYLSDLLWAWLSALHLG